MAARFHWDAIEWKKLGTSITIAVTGAAIPVFSQWVMDQDWGAWNTIAIPVGTVIVNAIRLWVRQLTEAPIDQPISPTNDDGICHCCGKPLP